MQHYAIIQYNNYSIYIQRIHPRLIEDGDFFARMLKDVVVFGDAVNDLVMFDDRWTSIAMGNGCQELKDKAGYVTAANTDDGILKACLHYGWITEERAGECGWI